MKSQERAGRTFDNLCNRSVTKMQYSFGRQKRFRQQIKTQLLDKFYDCSFTRSKGVIFSKGRRDLQKQIRPSTPSPMQYSSQQPNKKQGITFASSRQKCISSSVFYNTTVSYPGPGNYHPQQPKRHKSVILTGKLYMSYETISPGPKYNFQSTLLDRGKILSQQKRKGSYRFVLPTSKSRLADHASTESSASFKPTQGEGMMTRKGAKKIGLSGARAVIPQQTRFKSMQSSIGPGPGHYQTFSQFIETEKK